VLECVGGADDRLPEAMRRSGRARQRADARNASQALNVCEVREIDGSVRVRA
jgi:hypothetical protein